MRVRPSRLNTAIAGLFIVGSACFALGSVPAFANAVGGVADGIVFFVGSIFFTAASFLQLTQVRWGRRRPHDRNWSAAITQFPGTLFFNVSTLAALAHNASVREQDRHVWRPDIFGSTLFLVASVFGILAVGAFWSRRPRSLAWWIAWLNMIGSLLFMVSALASFVLPRSGYAINLRVDIAGTLFGALFFLVGALLMFPAWRRAVRDADATVTRPQSINKR